MISSCEKVKMLYLDFIRYMVSYVSDLIMHHTPMTRVYYYQERENSLLEG
jgi:hypothetical protein